MPQNAMQPTTVATGFADRHVGTVTRAIRQVLADLPRTSENATARGELTTGVERLANLIDLLDDVPGEHLSDEASHARAACIAMLRRRLTRLCEGLLLDRIRKIGATAEAIRLRNERPVGKSWVLQPQLLSTLDHLAILSTSLTAEAHADLRQAAVAVNWVIEADLIDGVVPPLGAVHMIGKIDLDRLTGWTIRQDDTAPTGLLAAFMDETAVA